MADTDPTQVGIRIGDIFAISFGYVASFVLAGLASIIGIPILNAIFNFLPVKEAVPESVYQDALKNAMLIFASVGGVLGGGLLHHNRFDERKCPHCSTNWARDKNGYIRTISDRQVEETATERETRGSGDTRQSRTKDLLRTYRVHVYNELRDCNACGEESEIERRDKTLVKEIVTATTPWQYD